MLLECILVRRVMFVTTNKQSAQAPPLPRPARPVSDACALATKTRRALCAPAVMRVCGYTSIYLCICVAVIYDDCRRFKTCLLRSERHVVRRTCKRSGMRQRHAANRDWPLYTNERLPLSHYHHFNIVIWCVISSLQRSHWLLDFAWCNRYLLQFEKILST